MSEVISFRLDPDNPREASAILVMQAWKDKGFSIAPDYGGSPAEIGYKWQK